MKSITKHKTLHDWYHSKQLEEQPLNQPLGKTRLDYGGFERKVRGKPGSPKTGGRM